MRTICLLLTLLASLPTFAQSPSGTVKGTVKSPSGTPLSRVSVQAANSGKGTSTDENGIYTLTLPAGNYEITYSAAGHTPQTVSVTITPGATIVQDIVLAAQSSSICSDTNPTPESSEFEDTTSDSHLSNLTRAAPDKY
jgi:iron complex outermembrane receptor protein